MNAGEGGAGLAAAEALAVLWLEESLGEKSRGVSICW